MRRNTPITNHVLLALFAMGLCTFGPKKADASCAPPAPVPLWWSPVKYANDIPLDTHLYVAPAIGQTLTIIFDGVELEPVGDNLGGGAIAYALPVLEPNTNYEFVMEISSPGSDIGSTSKKVKSNFTTGTTMTSGTTEGDISIAATEVWDDTTSSTISDECTTIFHAQDCFDTAGYTPFLIHASTDAVGYAVRPSVEGSTGGWSYWPASCPVISTVFGPTSPDTCFEVQALYSQGPGTLTTLVCPLYSLPITEQEDAGCRVSTSESNERHRIHLWIILLLGIMFSRLYRTKLTSASRRIS
jgi:hypothetical protein